MWKRLLKTGKSRLFCLLFLLFLLLPLFHSSYAAEPAEMVTMPRVQYNQLVTTIRMYENKSTMLEMKLETLQLNSTEALKALIEAQNQLAEVKATLAITKKIIAECRDIISDSKRDFEQAETTIRQIDEANK